MGAYRATRSRRRDKVVWCYRGPTAMALGRPDAAGSGHGRQWTHYPPHPSPDPCCKIIGKAATFQDKQVYKGARPSCRLRFVAVNYYSVNFADAVHVRFAGTRVCWSRNVQPRHAGAVHGLPLPEINRRGARTTQTWTNIRRSTRAVEAGKNAASITTLSASRPGLDTNPQGKRRRYSFGLGQLDLNH